MQTGKKIAVAGATGRVGRHVVEMLKERGNGVVPMSRSSGVDVVTGEGLTEALAGVECVIDVATWPTPEQQEATKFFTAATRNLHEAGERTGGAVDSRCVHNRNRPVQQRLLRSEARPRAGHACGPDPGPHSPGRAVP